MLKKGTERQRRGDKKGGKRETKEKKSEKLYVGLKCWTYEETEPFICSWGTDGFVSSREWYKLSIF